jgi:hypothetical protein
MRKSTQVTHVSQEGKPEPRIVGGYEMTYGRSLERYLKDLGKVRADGTAPAFAEWAILARDCAGWRELLTKRHFGVGKPHVRPTRCDTRVSPEDMRRFMVQRAAEVAAVAAPTP